MPPVLGPGRGRAPRRRGGAPPRLDEARFLRRRSRFLRAMAGRMSMLLGVLRLVNTMIARSLVVIVTGLFAVTVGLLFVQVIGRYLLGFSPLWVVETAQYSFVWLSFLAICIAFRRKAHMAIELLATGSPPGIRNVCKVLIRLSILTFGVSVTYSGIQVAGSMKETLSPGMQISMSWLYAAAPVCGVLVILFALESWLDGGRP